ncbi:MAG: preprotein translocase subunit SecE [Patescibacteria group bacterium]
MFTKIKNFFLESKQELEQVRWPTRKEGVYLTGVVIFVSLIFAVFLGAFDYLFSYALKVFVLKS